MKKIISLSLALLFFVLQNNTLIHAMSTEDAPISKGDPLTAEYIVDIKNRFEDMHRRISSSDPRPCRWSNCKDILSVEDDIKDLVDPRASDFRKVLVINIPELMGRELNDNFIKSIVKLHGEIAQIRETFSERSGIDKFSREFIIRTGEKLHNDESCRRALYTMSKTLKVPVDDLANAYISCELYDALIKRHEKTAIKSFVVGGGMATVATAITAGGIWYFGGTAGLMSMISSSAVSIALTCGVAVLSIGGIIATIGYGIYKINQADDEAIAKFKCQKVSNLANMIQRFIDILAMEPKTVMSCNILVTAIDKRVFETSGLFWHLRNKDLPNHGFWCEFRYISLPHSPIAKKYKATYTSVGDRTLMFYIDILRDMEYHDTRSLDFKVLDDYLEGRRMPKEIISMEEKRKAQVMIDNMHDPEVKERLQKQFDERIARVRLHEETEDETWPEWFTRIIGFHQRTSQQ